MENEYLTANGKCWNERIQIIDNSKINNLEEK